MLHRMESTRQMVSRRDLFCLFGTTLPSFFCIHLFPVTPTGALNGEAFSLQEDGEVTSSFSSKHEKSMDDVETSDDRDAKRIKLEVNDDQEVSVPANGESTPKEGDDDGSRADDQDQSREASVVQAAEDEDEVID